MTAGAAAPPSVPALPDEMRRLLRGLKLITDDRTDIPSRPLTGGVSSDIWLVELPGGPVCIKRALTALKVSAEWLVPVERSRYEYAWLQTVSSILPDAVPPLLGQSDDASMFVTGYLAPDEAPLWKGRLMRGDVDERFAEAVGHALGRIHAATAGDEAVARRFRSDALFHALRIDPYLLATAKKYPDLAPTLRALAETTASHKRALVHGDVSPKNILMGRRGPVFLDAECAWYGDPAFDLAFCLNHLLLKCIAIPDAIARLRHAFDALTTAYLALVDWEPRADLERRCAALLPGLFLARIDGKSPVEYITEETDRDVVRRFARPLLTQPVARLAPIAEGWFGRAS
jgi:aminoglycoside phosphotransferase (APT) family kinase protein